MKSVNYNKREKEEGESGSRVGVATELRADFFQVKTIWYACSNLTHTHSEIFIFMYRPTLGLLACKVRFRLQITGWKIDGNCWIDFPVSTKYF